MKHKTVTPKLTITSKTGGISIFPGKKYAYKLDKTEQKIVSWEWWKEENVEATYN